MFEKYPILVGRNFHPVHVTRSALLMDFIYLTPLLGTEKRAWGLCNPGLGRHTPLALNAFLDLPNLPTEAEPAVLYG